MPKTLHIPLSLILVFACSLEALASRSDGKTTAVTTYECISLYHQTDARGDCHVRYRPVGSDSWQRGLDLAFDGRDGQYRGSLVNLTVNTEYDIELSVGDQVRALQARTRSDRFPIGHITRLSGEMRSVADGATSFTTRRCSPEGRSTSSAGTSIPTQ